MNAVQVWQVHDSVSRDIIGRLNLAANKLPVDETFLDGIAFQALSLRSDPLRYRSVLGMIESLKGDADGVRAQLVEARPFASHNPGYFFTNFSISLAEVDAVADLRAFVAEGLESIGGDPAYLRSMVATLQGIGLVYTASDIRRRQLTLTGESERAYPLIKVTEELRNRNFSEEDLFSYFSFVREFLRGKGVRRFSAALKPQDAEQTNAPVCITEWVIPFSGEACVDLEDELFDLALPMEQFADVRRSVVFQFTPDPSGETGDDD